MGMNIEGHDLHTSYYKGKSSINNIGEVTVFILCTLPGNALNL